MTRAIPGTGQLAIDRIYAVVAFVAAAMAVADDGSCCPAVVVFAILALVPWALVFFGLQLPMVVFTVLAIAPLIPIFVLTGITSAMFLTIIVAARLASRSENRVLVYSVAVFVVASPFLPVLLGDKWDIGAVYFSFGGTFGVLAGLLIRRTTRLAENLQAAEAELAAGAAREERHRIARDVHDLVAHSLTVVVLHVGGARRLLRTDPSAAENALSEAERVCRESLDGIRGVVGLLRQDGEPQELSLDFGQLVETYRRAGLAVRLEESGSTDAVPLIGRVTLYRVVQEALANAARYSGPSSRTQVDVAVSDEEALVRVSSDLTIKPGTGAGQFGGFGLLGLEEQVDALGGELFTGRRAGSWVVECRLPLVHRDAQPQSPEATVSK